MIRRTCFRGVVILTLLVPATAADAGEVEVGRVKTEWQAAARRLDQSFARARVKARIREDDPRASAKSTLTEAQFAVDHGMQKVEFSIFTQDPNPVKRGDGVYCVGDGTAFELRRRAGAEGYSVKGIGATSEELDRYMSVFGRFLIAHNAVGGLPISQFLDKPGFKINAAETFVEDGKTLMKVDCGIKGRALFVLDPEAGWVVRSCKFHPIGAPQELTTFEIEYGTPHDGVPVPRLVKRQDPDGIVMHCDFSDWTFAPTPVSEFSMTHYGLADLQRPIKPRVFSTYWLVINSVLLGGVALFLWHRASRGSSRAEA